ncbi:hypothetical protein [Novosphingobium sp. FKTRR1]|uniref:hypothetical protein n=1 Tax=Novosphingobium sp. FKTRR1 TaxID=2879118 RepID=UPI001CF097B7|nr:hypothetical protein [Novosphingobium sp. FKTRR1]
MPIIGGEQFLDRTFRRSGDNLETGAIADSETIAFATRIADVFWLAVQGYVRPAGVGAMQLAGVRS